MTRFTRFTATLLLCAFLAAIFSGCGGKRKKETNPVSVEAPEDTTEEFASWQQSTEIRAQIENGDYESARRQLIKTIDADPQNAQAHFFLGKCYLEENELNRAKNSLQNAVDLDPLNRDYARELGKCLVKISDRQIDEELPSESIANLKKALLLEFEPNQTRDKLANAYSKTAQTLIENGNSEDAENLLIDALNQIPDMPSLRVKLAEVLIENDRLMEAERILSTLSETNPNYEKGLISYASLLYRMGEVNNAKDVLNKALSIAPADPEGLALKAKIERNVPAIEPEPDLDESPAQIKEQFEQLKSSGDYAQQKELLNQLVTKFPEEGWAYLELSQIDEKLELYDEALKNARLFVESSPESAEGKFQLASVFTQKGAYEKALNLLKSLNDSAVPEEEILNLSGQILARMGNFDQAREKWNQALEINPEHAATIFSIGQLEMETGKIDQAQHHFEQAVKIDPFNAKFRYFAGLNLIQSRLQKQAHNFWAASIEYLNRQNPYTERIMRALDKENENLQNISNEVESQPEDLPLVKVPSSVIEESAPDPEYKEALDYARKGYFNEAINGFRNVINRNPSNFNALMNLGKVYAITGKTARSCALYLKALKIEPANTHALKALANAYSDIGLHRFAAGVTAEARTTHPGALQGFPEYKEATSRIQNNPRAYQPIINALLAEDLDQEALALLKTGISEQQESATLLMLQGEIHKELGQFDTALDSYRKALKLEPQNPQPYVKAGDLLLSAGQYSKAIQEYKKALKASFIDPDTMFVIVDRFKQLGRDNEAKRVLGRLKSMNLNQRQVAKLEAHLGAPIEISPEENN
ncbi:MAG: tetratricopeptide repeat protein [Candidatus Rifleibacteriota bacterium]